LPTGTKIQLLAPVVRGKKGEHAKVLERAGKNGYVRARIDGNMYELTEEIKLDKNIKHNIEIVVDRLVIKPEILMRLSSSVENVLDIAEGLLTVDVIGGEELHFSRSFSCPDCGVSIDEIEPRSFSFNNPFGACPVCAGIGYSMEFSEELMIPGGRNVMKGSPAAWKNKYGNGFVYAISPHIERTEGKEYLMANFIRSILGV
ncbi:MAG: hypothetical protein II088_03370, partial [Bacteroidales bacterium]|nr:hypothetical protein [Bacteroidales bacterium]